MFIVSLTEICAAPCERGSSKTQIKSVYREPGSGLPFASYLYLMRATANTWKLHLESLAGQERGNQTCYMYFKIGRVEVMKKKSVNEVVFCSYSKWWRELLDVFYMCVLRKDWKDKWKAATLLSLVTYIRTHVDEFGDSTLLQMGSLPSA